MRNTDDFKERFRRWKNGENYWAIRKEAAQKTNDPNEAYDYVGYLNQYGTLEPNHPSQHYLDEYKMTNHPTFSKFSYRSNPITEGGDWSDDGKKFQLSDYMMNTYGSDRTLDYLRGTGVTTTYKGGTVLPEIYVTPKGNDVDLVPSSRGGWRYHDAAEYSGGKPKGKYVYDVLPGLFAKDGVKITVSSGYRPGAVVADTGKPSRHGAHLAADIVGDFAQIRKVLDNPNSNVSKWMVANGYGYIDETAKTGTTKHWSSRRRRKYEQGISDNSHYHIGADSYYSRSYAAQMNKLLAQAALTKPSVTYAMQSIVQPEPPAIPVTTKFVDTNKIYGPIELPNVNVVGDIRAAIQKMDEEKRNRALDEITRFGPLPNPIAFFNSFWGEDLPTRQSLNKPTWTVQ